VNGCALCGNARVMAWRDWAVGGEARQGARIVARGCEEKFGLVRQGRGQGQAIRGVARYGLDGQGTAQGEELCGCDWQCADRDKEWRVQV